MSRTLVQCLVIQELICIVPFRGSYSEPKGNSSSRVDERRWKLFECVLLPTPRSRSKHAACRTVVDEKERVGYM